MSNHNNQTEIILIGAGIMSATLGAIIKELAPHWKITVFEKLKRAGEESSNEWNNAGTGHSSLCELNYTPEKEDGSIDISKAIKVNEDFQVSRQFWAYLVKNNLISNPENFVMPLPHLSLVHGEDNVNFLYKRFKALSNNPLFKGMEFSDDPKKLKDWMPLVMEDREINDPIAATKIESGTDVNFGALTRILFEHLKDQGVEIHYEHEVKNLEQDATGAWNVTVRNLQENTTEQHSAKFVFIGAGGGSLHLLQKSGIKESVAVGGFPVSGLFLVCKNPEVVAKHHAKVYGKAAIGAPPMSVPHLDTRYINNEQSLFFGPFAGFSPKFLKTGSNLDLIKSVKLDNVFTMLAAGSKNLSLTRYLIGQLLLSKEQRMEALREFVPTAKSEDCELVVAGQRVQVIKDDEKGKGTLKFGTEVIHSPDGSIAALLGASPGASTAVSIMLEILEKCFPEHMKEWEPKIREMIPSYGISLSDKPELVEKIQTETADVLGLVAETEPKAASDQ